jgi:type IV pilus assembly protein PilW
MQGKSFNRRTRNSGFSLVELLLALGLGLVVTSGIVQLFVGNNQTYTMLMGQSRLQEGARFSLDFISRSARSTGYFGCDPETDKIYNTLNGPWTDVYEFDLSTPIEAYNYSGNGIATAVGDWTPALNPLPRKTGATTSVNTFVDGTGIDLATVAPSTDIIVFRRVDIPGSRIAGVVQPGDNPVVIDDGNVNIQANDFAVISNCEQAALFRVTGVAVGANITLSRASGAGTYENSAAKTLSDENIPYGNAINGQGSTVGRVITDIYFIADGAGTNNVGATPLSLWLRSGINAPVELVEGIRDLQVRFGVDNTPTDPIRAPNRYVDFDAINANDIVRTMRIEVTASTVDVITNGNTPVTRTFVQTISMRNT